MNKDKMAEKGNKEGIKVNTIFVSISRQLVFTKKECMMNKGKMAEKRNKEGIKVKNILRLR